MSHTVVHADQGKLKRERKRVVVVINVATGIKINTSVKNVVDGRNGGTRSRQRPITIRVSVRGEPDANVVTSLGSELTEFEKILV